ncbi:ER membrane protein complex subunit 8-like [Apostichopus japonicus]|uniref:ER membrane protein complex subunit 8-like n=1 Tax=Stichopus japonicus TaxID=307972 RepID=UPI003AB41874
MALTVTKKAFCKCLLHVSKYPYSAVNGVFLADKKKFKDSKDLTVVDAVPLFHQCVGLAAMLEIALMQIDSYCEANGLILAGYYHANEHLEDNVPSLIATKIADKLHDNFSDSCLFVINNEKIDGKCGKDALVLYQSTDGKWKPSSTGFKLDVGTSEACAELLESRAEADLIDFDSHLDDITKEWQNRTLSELIDSRS